jgi:hypothetical protein
MFTCLFSHSFGVMHAMGMLALSFYGWVPFVCTTTTTTTATAWDATYLATFAALPLSWLVCQDECVLSAWWKKMKIPTLALQNLTFRLRCTPSFVNMAPGNFDDDEDDDDITMALLGSGLSRETVDIGLFVVQAARVVSVLSVHMRSHLLPGWLVLPSLVLYLVYVDDIAAKRWGRWCWWQLWLRIALGSALMLWETKLLMWWS